MPALRVAVETRLPVVVVAGRPNVGKSTLVNRFVGRRTAVVEERPGVTRDRLELQTEWNGRSFTVVDTGGWLASGDELDNKVASQALQAVDRADLVLVVVDVTVGATSEDREVARRVLRARVPAILVANKVDNAQREAEAWALVSLGLGDPYMVSALHGRRTAELLDEVVRRLGPAASDGEPGVHPVGLGPALDSHEVEAAAEAAGEPHPADEGAARGVQGGVLRVAIAGRPNVGKSTLFNRLVGEERAIVHDVPGTTRDAIDTLLETSEGHVRFVDTAGMRRRVRSAPGTEYFSMVRTLKAIDDADVVILVVDSTEGVTHQDQRLAERIGASGSPVVVALNKWEILPTERRRRVVDDVDDRLAFLGDVPVLKVSALTGLGIHRIVKALRGVAESYHRRVPTSTLNRVVAALQAAHPAPGARIRYAVQGAIDPPTFTLFATRRIPQTYLRYLERRLREELGMGGTPLKLRVRTGS
jgi:GTPase